MAIADRLNRSCLITHRSRTGPADELGDVTDEETTTETVCELQQKSRDEPDAAGELSVTEWLLILPINTAIDTSDKVEVDDAGEFEVIGDPWQADTGSAAVHHVEATLRRVGPGTGS